MAAPRILGRIARRLAASATNRVVAGVDQRVADSAEAVTQRLLEMNHTLTYELEGVREMVLRLGHETHVAKGQLADIEHHLPALLNAISSQHAAERVARRRLQELADDLAGVSGQLRQQHDGATEAAAKLEELRHSVDELIEARATTATYDHVRRANEEVAEILNARIGDTHRRLEFVRRELMHELHYAGRGPSAPDPRAGIELDRPRFPTTAVGDPVRLNLGAGHLPKPGFTNVDNRALDGIELRADVRDLPFGTGEVAEIHADHLLEHFPEEELRRVVLPHWHSLLEPGGKLALVVPDAEAMLDAHATGAFSFDDLRLVTFGEQEYQGDFHFTMFSASSLASLLKESGFTDIEIVASARPNGVCLEMEVHARTPSPAV